MRNVLYINRESTLYFLWAMAVPGDLIVVPTEEWAERARAGIRELGAPCLQDIIELHPLMNADEARNQSVEVRTRAELEQIEWNERMAMEVL